MTDKLDEMWEALAEHQPAPSYAEAWQMMIKERTQAAAWNAEAYAARAAARATSAAARATSAAEAARAARTATRAAAEEAAMVREHGKRAIDTIRGVQI